MTKIKVPLKIIQTLDSIGKLLGFDGYIPCADNNELCAKAIFTNSGLYPNLECKEVDAETRHRIDHTLRRTFDLLGYKYTYTLELLGNSEFCIILTE